MHFYLYNSITLTGFATASLDIKGESSRVVTAHLSILRVCKQLADIVENSGIGCRVRARRSTNRRLVDGDDFVKLPYPFDRLVLSGLGSRAVEDIRKLFIKYFIDKRRFSRARNSRNGNKHSERYFNIDVFEVVLGRTDYLEAVAVAFPT